MRLKMGVFQQVFEELRFLMIYYKNPLKIEFKDFDLLIKVVIANRTCKTLTKHNIFYANIIRIDRQVLVNEIFFIDQIQSQLSESMFEFTPFNPFSKSTLSNEEPLNQESSYKQPPESTINNSGTFDYPKDQPPIKGTKASKQRQNSHNHNMVKQMIITIRQMMRSSMKDIGVGKIKKVVEQIWEIFMAETHPSKEMLKAIFDSNMDEKLLRKYKLSQIIEEHGIEEYKAAIQELKRGILFKMKSENVKQHLLDRRVQHKERLCAVILYFLHEEMKIGRIAHRQGEKATQKIEKILLQSREEINFMDSFFPGQEVIERFASLNNETS